MAVSHVFLNNFGVTVLLGLVVFFLLVWLIRNHTVRNLPPGPKSWPVVGCIPELLYTIITTKPKSSLDLFNSLYAVYGPVCCLSFPFGMRIVLVSGYQAVNKAVLTINDRPPMTTSNQSEELINGGGIIMSSGELWKEQRRFSVTVLRGLGVGKRSFEDQIAAESQCLIEEMSSLDEKPFDPADIFTKSVSNVICSVVFGKRFEYDDKEFNRLLYLLEESQAHMWFTILFITLPRLLPYLVKIPYFPNDAWLSVIELRRNLKDIIDRHRQTLDPNSVRDFIDAYLNELKIKDNKGEETCFSDTELVVVVHDFFLAGTDTTSSTLLWALLYMVEFPEIQKRVHEEIDAAVGRDRLPRLADKSNLQYTQAVIHEIQRLSCVATITGARYVDRPTEIGGFTVPKDAYMVVNLFSVTRDPAVWEKPDEFVAERFLDDKGQVVKIPELIVFSAGKRVCPGEHLARMEIFIFYTHLMHQFRFEKSTEEALCQDRYGGTIARPLSYNIRAIRRV